jgi:hypothetical protein
MKQSGENVPALTRIELNAGFAAADCNLAIRQALMLITGGSLQAPAAERHDRAPAFDC